MSYFVYIYMYNIVYKYIYIYIYIIYARHILNYPTIMIIMWI